MGTKAFLCNEVQKRMQAEMKQTGIAAMEMGYANGYVAVSPDHPLCGKNYDQVNGIDVWGGLTLACAVSDFAPKEEDIEMLDGGTFADIPKDWWLFGFDTMHAFDDPHHDREWCIAETRRLQKQLEG